MPYTYRSLREIDSFTYDYLKFVLPNPIEDTSIEEINNFLNTLEKNFLELDNESKEEYSMSD